MQYLKSTDKPNYHVARELLNNASLIYYDLNGIKREYDNAQSKQRELMEQMIYQCGATFNPNSPKQVKDILFNVLKLNKSLFMEYGKVTTKGKIIDRAYQSSKHPFIKNLIDYRYHASTTKALDDLLRNSSSTDLVNAEGNPLISVRPTWKQSISWRFTSSAPNIQGLRKDLRQLNCAADGYSLLSMDIRQQELIIFFHYIAPNPILLEYLKENDEDYYLTVTHFCMSRDYLVYNIKFLCNEMHWDPEKILNSEIGGYFLSRSGKLIEATDTLDDLPYKLNNIAIYNALKSFKFPLDKIDKQYRDSYKLCILMGIYGASLDSLKEEVDKNIATSFYRTIHSLPELIKYTNHAKANIKEGNLDVLSYFRTPSTISDKGYKYKLNNFLNRPVQTTGADLMAFILEGFFQWREQRGFTDKDINVTYTLYDELNFTIKKDLLEYVPEIVGLAEFQIEDWSPMFAEYNVGDRNVG